MKEKIKKLFFGRPILNLIVLVIVHITLSFIVEHFQKTSGIMILLFDILNILIAIYFVGSIVYILHRRFKYLMNPKNLRSLIFAYALFIMIILLIWSTVFSIVQLSHLGYITYGNCSDKFEPSMIASDPNISTSFLYFTAITFFSIGYGDICPMGWSKLVSVFTAFTGHLVSVILVALIINNYLRLRSEKK